MPAERPNKTRLTTWKEVAAFFGKSERTVMRWEADRGLPVHRIPGEGRAGIYADTPELEAWLAGPGAAASAADSTADLAAPIGAAPAAAAPVAVGRATPRASPWRAGAAAIGVAVAALLAVVVARALPRAPAPPPPAAQTLYIAGLQNWAQRTPPALNRAVDEFAAAIRIDENYAEAYVGLANCYLLLREFAAMPSAQAYALARSAAARAIALQPDLAGAHAAYGFALLYGDWQFATGLAELKKAVRMEPDNPGLQHWYATALMAVGQGGVALVHIERALELDPGARAVQADRALILLALGRTAEARRLLSDLELAAPDFLSPHAYLAVLALDAGDDRSFLREARISASLQHDAQAGAIARAAQAGYDAGGHAGLLRALLQSRLAALAAGTGSARDVARVYAVSGDKPQTLVYLVRAIERRDQNAFADVSYITFRSLLGDAALAPLRAKLALP